MIATKEFVSELNNYLNISSAQKYGAGMDAGTIMVQHRLNGFVRDILKSVGFSPSDNFNPVVFQREANLDTPQTTSYGQFIPDGHRIDMFGYNLPANPAQVLMVTAHETMHMIQRFVLEHGYDKEIESDFSSNSEKSNKDELDQAAFESAQQAFFGYHVTEGCDYQKFKTFLQNEPLFNKDVMPIFRDDMTYYSSANGYTSNLIEVQANSFASKYASENIDMSGLHDMDKLAVVNYMDDTLTAFLSNASMNQTAKAATLKQVKAERKGWLHKIFNTKADREYLRKKDVEGFVHACQKISEEIQVLKEQTSQIVTVEQRERQQIETEQEREAALGIEKAVEEYGLRFLPKDIDTTHIEGAIAREFDSNRSLLAAISGQYVYMDDDLKNRLYIDVENKLIIIDGGRAIRNAIVESQERAQEIVDRALDQDGVEEKESVKGDGNALDEAR